MTQHILLNVPMLGRAKHMLSFHRNLNPKTSLSTTAAFSFPSFSNLMRKPTRYDF